MQLNKNITTFLGFDDSYEDADIVIFGAPFDGITSIRPGTGTIEPGGITFNEMLNSIKLFNELKIVGADIV